jgi:sugar lactone lactonase YvrE
MRVRLFRPVLLFPIVACVLLVSVPTAWSQQRTSTVIRERLKTRPDDPTLYYYLSLFEILEGNRAAGLEALKHLEQIGTGFLPVRGTAFDSVWTDTSFQRTRRALEAKLPRVTRARELFKLDKGVIPEGITYDPITRSYFVGSIAREHIFRVDSAGTVSAWSKPGELDQVLGLVVDGKRRRLHAVSTSALAAGGQKPVNRIVSYDLDSGARIRAIDVSAAAQLNDVAVSPGGDLFTSDSRASAVYRIRDTGAVDTLVAPGALPGANGVAVSADATALYVGHSTGIARVEIGSRAILPRIELPAGETVAAIDGLYADGATLIGIQNLTNPGRVIRVHLRPDGKGAERVETLLSHHHPAIDEPTTGVIVGRTFALLATTQVARFGPDGKIQSPETLKPPIVLSIDLDASSRN